MVYSDLIKVSTVAIPYSGTLSIFSLSRNGNVDVFTAKSGLNLSQNVCAGQFLHY